jgi:fatty acid desaturase
MWRQQHVVGHHAYTNLDGVDPDLRTSENDVRSVTPHAAWHPYHVRQPFASSI